MNLTIFEFSASLLLTVFLTVYLTLYFSSHRYKNKCAVLRKKLAAAHEDHRILEYDFDEIIARFDAYVEMEALKEVNQKLSKKHPSLCLVLPVWCESLSRGSDSRLTNQYRAETSVGAVVITHDKNADTFKLRVGDQPVVDCESGHFVETSVKRVVPAEGECEKDILLAMAEHCLLQYFSKQHLKDFRVKVRETKKANDSFNAHLKELWSARS